MGAFPIDLASMAWTQLWQLSLAALAVGALVRLVGRRRPHLAYVLWLVVIAKCLTPPVWRRYTSVRLFAAGWTNPHPEKKIARIDYLAAGTQAAPFCLGITIEEPISK